MFTIDELKRISNRAEIDKDIEILEKANTLIQISSNENRNLYSFYIDCGRNGHIEGTFKATKKQILKYTGRCISFDDILGKHSYVEWIFNSNEDNLELKSCDPIEVYLAKESGINPINYFINRDTDDGEDDE